MRMERFLDLVGDASGELVSVSETVAVMKTVEASLRTATEDLMLPGEKAWLAVNNEVNSSVRRMVLFLICGVGCSFLMLMY